MNKIQKTPADLDRPTVSSEEFVLEDDDDDSLDKSAGADSNPRPEEVQSNALPTRLSGLVANYACGIAPLKRRQRPAVILFKGLYSGTSDGSFV
ncbi:hypothetical protein TNCV_1202191 [Trichonephila clavipes]|nr:hypothetical protein TNCV_1202191 [Trichonephila clavipes]